nr:MAG TPA: hypothetical protein [Caudoviricetes sp.]
MGGKHLLRITLLVYYLTIQGKLLDIVLVKVQIYHQLLG